LEKRERVRFRGGRWGGRVNASLTIARGRRTVDRGDRWWKSHGKHWPRSDNRTMARSFNDPPL